MVDIFMKKIFLLLFAIVFLGAGCRKDISDTPGSDKPIASYKREASLIPSQLPIEKSITCEFNRINHVSFEVREDENKIGSPPQSDIEKAKIYYSSSVESQPNIASFVDLDTKSPKIVGNNGQDDLIKIYEDEEVVHLITKGTLDFGVAIFYTIYKKEGVAIWTKQYSLLGFPVGYMAMGYCK